MGSAGTMLGDGALILHVSVHTVLAYTAAVPKTAGEEWVMKCVYVGGGGATK